MTVLDESTSTRPSEDAGTYGWDRGLRIVSVSLVSVVVLVGLLGFLGVRSTTASASANGFTLQVHHASITRPGLATPFGLRISREDGSPLPDTITTRITSSYLAMFDENSLDPQPASSFQSDEWTWWTFQVPEDAGTLAISFDARLEPAVQRGQRATVAVEVDDEPVVAVDFETRVMP